MTLFDNRKHKKDKEADEILTELKSRVQLDRGLLQSLPAEELSDLVDEAQGAYFHGLSAARAGRKDVARTFYRKAFELLPTHIEALDNYGIGLVEELKFQEARPYFEQSALADPSSPLAFVYLVKCYQETGSNRLAFLTADYLAFYWPDKSPFPDWTHLGQPRRPLPLIAPPFAEGQVWRYKARPVDQSSRIWIRLVDLYQENMPLVHISVTKVHQPGDHEVFISHLPYKPAALSDSVLKLTDEQQQWDVAGDVFGQGYALWSEAYNAGEAGVFTVPLEQVLNQSGQFAG